MTWLVGATCFNGFLCAADIQATFSYPDGRPNKYLNCIQKVHKVYDNLIVGFSGDIRLGLLIIEELRQHLEHCLRPIAHIFDLDGETHVMEHNLTEWHNKHLIPGSLSVEFMFCWFVQDEGESFYKPYVCKFLSPSFKRDGTGMLQKVLQSGSGKNVHDYQEVVHFLSGQASAMNEFYRKIYLTSDEDRIIFTVRKLRKLLVNELKKTSAPGVSKSLISFEATMHFDKLYTPEASRDLQDIVEKFGISQVTSYALEKPDSYISFDPDQYQKKFVELFETNPSEALEILKRIRNLQNAPSWRALNEFPILEEFYDGDISENIEKQVIACSWQDFQRLVSHKGIKLNACTASA